MSKKKRAMGCGIGFVMITVSITSTKWARAAEIPLSSTEVIQVQSPCEEKLKDCPKPILRLSVGNEYQLYSQDGELHVGRSLLFEKKGRRFIEIPNDIFLSPNGKFLVAIDNGEFGDNGSEIRLFGLEKGAVISLDSLKPEQDWSPQDVLFDLNQIVISGYKFASPDKKIYFEYVNQHGRWTLIQKPRR